MNEHYRTVEEKLSIDSVDFVSTETFFHGEQLSGEVAIEYVEHSTDYWSSDTHVSINVTKQDAQAIIEFLRRKFSI